jgi:hypothetical protein
MNLDSHSVKFPKGVRILPVRGTEKPVDLPLSSLLPTKALESLLSSSMAHLKQEEGYLCIGRLRLCKSFAVGRCHLGENCRNIHIVGDGVASQAEMGSSVPLPPLSARNADAAPSISVKGASSNVTLPPLVFSSPPQERCNSPVATTSRRPRPNQNQPGFVPTPAPPNSIPNPDGRSSGSLSCLRRFARRWNAPLQTSGSAECNGSPSPKVSLSTSLSGSLDVSSLQEMLRRSEGTPVVVEQGLNPSAPPLAPPSAPKEHAFVRTGALLHEGKFTVSA